MLMVSPSQLPWENGGFTSPILLSVHLNHARSPGARWQKMRPRNSGKVGVASFSLGASSFTERCAGETSANTIAGVRVGMPAPTWRTMMT